MEPIALQCHTQLLTPTDVSFFLLPLLSFFLASANFSPQLPSLSLFFFFFLTPHTGASSFLLHDEHNALHQIRQASQVILAAPLGPPPDLQSSLYLLGKIKIFFSLYLVGAKFGFEMWL